MRTGLLSREERYVVEGKDERGLIPEGTTDVLIEYNQKGRVVRVFYSKRYGLTGNREEIQRQQEELDAMNSRVLSSIEMEKIAGLLKLASYS
ncbi:MAG: hypothetical protein NTW17_01570 [Candidatus Pacearchaeota archaeon]|nr:hypothetical protein [Candidatus Pacearchaeota archaeon]